ncbi:MAG TPA: C-terminal binding protein [Chloroflexota bacterium]|nr:C-terminal binding protein [Chloroflexota bacterium]
MSQARPLVVRLGAPLVNPQPEQALLEEAGGDLRMVAPTGQDDAIAAMRDAEIVLNAGGVRFSAEVIAQLPRCRAIIQNSVGYDRIDVEAATARKIMVANLPDYCIEEVSDHAVALLLASARRLFVMQKILRDDRWGMPGVNTQQLTGTVERLSERTLGIVGFGNIGRLVAKKTRGIFARLITADPYVKPEVAAQHGVELLPLDDLLRQADYVTLHVLLTDETRHLINAERLWRMKPGAYIVNTCRGPVIDERALIAALEAGRLAGAGLDVFEEEPIRADHPLAQRDDVIVTPHLAVFSRTAMENWRIQPFQDAARILKGYYPRGMVNRQLKATLGLREEAT